MTDTQVIVIVTGFAIVCALFFSRRHLKRFQFKAGRRGLDADLQVHDPNNRANVVVRRLKLRGKANVVDLAHDSAHVEDSVLHGERHRITIRGSASLGRMDDGNVDDNLDGKLRGPQKGPGRTVPGKMRPQHTIGTGRERQR